MSTAESWFGVEAHNTVVADVQAALPHMPAALADAVADAPDEPKLSPLIVSVPPALGAALAGALKLTTGADKQDRRVPEPVRPKPQSQRRPVRSLAHPPRPAIAAPRDTVGWAHHRS